MFSFKGALSKVGKAILAQGQLHQDLATQRQLNVGLWGSSGMVDGPEKPKINMSAGNSRACRIMARACKAGQSGGQVSLSYSDALHVLNVLQAAKANSST